VGKITEKAVCESVFFTPWHCILSAELIKTHSFRDCFLGDFAHWDMGEGEVHDNLFSLDIRFV